MSQKVKIGQSDVVSTPLGFGTNAVGGHNLFPNLDEQAGMNSVRAALDSGITMLDTAFAYGFGRSEELIGKVLKDYDRSKVVVATKGAQIVNGDQVTISNRPADLEKFVKDSLKRLNTDYLDIFYIHFPDDQTPKAEAIGKLAELKKQGLIKAIGVSNFSLEQLKEANQNHDVDIVEDQYSLVHRDAEKELFPYLEQEQISFVPFFPLASGLLTGKYDGSPVNFPEDDLRSGDPNFSGSRFHAITESVKNLQPIADNHDATIAQVVLAWYIKNPDISVVIPGAKTPEQVRSNAKAMNVALSDQEYNTIDNAFRF
ncbi:aldo/keto reductase [Lentilactobacillus buchneri]|uniref:NADP-dependent oxidoreductase domain-containing protein n=1 Tax=Lentilactobacillus buchneri DSM 20057 TaxID=1423728 RepID=A0A4R5NUM7_LENBU|nr:aldo/keto reductase [Lentilactobacillus buchneri]WCJ51011.1 aldo/keto reductase [Lentilactobacillus sp. Egmn17]AEB74430.1 NADP-dependent oxidoreductase domain protein [Lentilactobacillus buchneri NRRL B-30929]KRK68462.1 NADP-dependent oxidoreductase domain-containing protein [Lentilactobacillus buchneri DSM 20057]MCT2882400.1 aldo/keto reductase [Lentilactobacillus buchneri]MCT2899533.1 aldo/keto reductase [Lentilactobacillus buchneri]